MNRIFTFFVCSILSVAFSFSQVVFYQDLVKGGVTSSGVNLAATGDNPLNFSVFIESGSTIKKAFLFFGADGIPPDLTITLNGISYILNSESIITSGFLSWYLAPPTSSVHVLDITNDINPNVLNYTLDAPAQDFSSQQSYFQYNLIIVYENPLLTEIAVNIIVNDKNVSDHIVYNLINLLPIIYSNPIGIGVVGRHFCDAIQDGSFVSINSTPIGLIGGNDANSPPTCSGVRGDFYYQNNTLFGLDDDIPDALMAGSDAIANIQTYVSNNDTHLDLEFNYQNLSSPNGVLSNPIMGVTLAYTTPCTSFLITTPNDSTICQGTTLQLNATGGFPTSNSATGYEWSPSIGLSCTDCPNPVFTADSSMFYTVRIWNTDSCSVVRPLKINILPTPLWDSLAIMPSVCGASTGSVTAFASPNNSVAQSWSEVGGSPQISNVFQNLSGGNHTFFFIDTNGCQSSDTTVFIPYINPTIAQFTANPVSGAAPLTVDFTNTSQFATDYLWTLNGINQGNNLQNYTFDTSGTYFVELIAWQHDMACADTFSIQILVFDSLILQIPNVFSPNCDGVNDLYTLESNVPVSVNYSIVNRWGETMLAQTIQVGPGKTVLWDGISNGNAASEGTYFYSIEATTTFDYGIIGKTVTLSGFLQVV